MKDEYERGRSFGQLEGRQAMYTELELAYQRGLEHGLRIGLEGRRQDERPTRAEALEGEQT